ncbi:WD domain, G-beta repeat domain-containing protein [Hirsutella rhossiliensis]|uniref:WD domain, g-beta repeat domain-containing protein n=1 Tax=Hirsutella rhossiliensis TaxID=111463 RepID=A0A9P8N117_9HYPO|nr:WD domain, g-beta repeat domain-containing protein [Hirsutella rhossiliensis]KAH0964890.1 WD domain, g-beta repeat domain-containing protein [Hirsutella rhossiliensis]
MSQSQQLPPPRRPVGSGAYGQDELHMSGMVSSPQGPHLSSSRDYAPQIKLEQPPPTTQPPSQHQQPPGAMSANTAPTALPTIHGSMSSTPQHQPSSHDYHTSSKPSLTMPHSHSYSRSSPTAGYDVPPSSYHAYTPTTPTGLADIRPRADSSMSDSAAGTAAHDLANAQPGPSNYLAPWAVYALDWCKWPPQGTGAGKLAVGSYLEDGHNFIQILNSQVVPTSQDVYTPGSSKYSLEFTKVAEATHSYPVTRLLWEPPSSQKQSTDLLATSGDHLRLWSLPSESPANPGSTITRATRDTLVNKLTPLALLSNSKTPDHTAPLTSLDWNTVSPSLIITSSIDTTCTIWDIPSLTAKTQLIAHDKEVYDVRFCANSVDVFVSCGQDGSVRMFDLRSLEHSTIIYEPTGKEDRDNSGRTSPTAAQLTPSSPPPLLRLATSPHDTHLLATFAQDSNIIRILDVRQPGQALLELRGHSGSINCLEWSPLRRGTLASGGDDCQVLVWDLLTSGSSTGSHPPNGAAQQDNNRGPVACWECDYEVGNLGWAPHLPNADYGEWLAVGAGRGIWGTRLI